MAVHVERFKMLAYVVVLLSVASICNGKSLNYRGRMGRGYDSGQGSEQYQSYYDQQGGNYYYPQVDGQPIYIPSIAHSASNSKDYLDDYYYRDAWKYVTKSPYNYDTRNDYYESPVTANSIVKNFLGETDVEGHRGEYHYVAPETLYNYEGKPVETDAEKSYLEPTESNIVPDESDVPGAMGTPKVNKYYSLDDYEQTVTHDKVGTKNKDKIYDYPELEQYLGNEDQSSALKPNVVESGSEYESPVIKEKELERQKTKEKVVKPKVPVKSEEKFVEPEEEYTENKYELPVVRDRINIKQKPKIPEVEYVDNYGTMGLKPDKMKTEKENDSVGYGNKLGGEKTNKKANKTKRKKQPPKKIDKIRQYAEGTKLETYEVPVNKEWVDTEKEEFKKDHVEIASDSKNYKPEETLAKFEKEIVKNEKTKTHVKPETDCEFIEPEEYYEIPVIKERTKVKTPQVKTPYTAEKIEKLQKREENYEAPVIKDNMKSKPEVQPELYEVPLFEEKDEMEYEVPIKEEEKVIHKVESPVKEIKSEIYYETPVSKEEVEVKLETPEKEKIKHEDPVRSEEILDYETPIIKEKIVVKPEESVTTKDKVTKPNTPVKTKEKVVIKPEKVVTKEKVKNTENGKIKEKVIIKPGKVVTKEKVHKTENGKIKEKVVIKQGAVVKEKVKTNGKKEKVVVKPELDEDYLDDEFEEVGEDDISMPFIGENESQDLEFEENGVDEPFNTEEEIDFENDGSGKSVTEGTANIPRMFPNLEGLKALSSLNSNIWSLLFNPNAERNKLKACVTRANETGFCSYVQHCEVPDIAASLDQLLNNACVMDDVFIGVCCPEFPVQTVKVHWEEDASNPEPQIEAEFGRGTEDCGIRSKEASEANSWPWKAPLVSMSNGKIFCGGVVISEDYVLTAAHCTTKIPKNQILVRLGQHDESTGEDFAVIEIKRHAQYNPRTMHNDIALLKLGRRIVHDAFTGVICLPDEDDDEDEHNGEKATLLGWKGIFGANSKKTEFLEVIDSKECASKLRSNVPKTMLCTEARTEDERTCNADSGAPLVIEDDGKYEVIGILGWNRKDCDQRFPSTFSRVSRYVGWIQKHAV